MPARRVRTRTFLLCVVLGALVAAPAARADDAQFARNIIPSGQYGALPIPPAPTIRRRCTTA